MALVIRGLPGMVIGSLLLHARVTTPCVRMLHQLGSTCKLLTANHEC